ncbi:hypothetical protein CEUSTIGMA_g7164.t1 [Chlamydomonas eustigma]|uniref:Uncharacterized protein n=1 Tax=Chlamydomonas eustigma TaxID=1157962 RepID=A0A250X9F7_9CHLO|nr:hypothetical protein CEUSTIGMA_g7164.t1 [Chlamydomonas eustigma]|eukprot:GAX79723.1 hypothetical protein CEUSTIGMA_g7164.t1 [Chlamydomonas eustigma]
MSKRPGEHDGGPAAKVVRIELKSESNGIKEEDWNGTRSQKRAKYPFIFYKESPYLPGLQQIYNDPTIEEKFAEVVISSEAMSNSNRKVKTRQLWGDKIYTGDSDIVAALMHMGYFANFQSQAAPSASEFRAVLKLLPPQNRYPAKARFVKSRAWNSTIKGGFSYQIESCMAVSRSGNSVELQPYVDETLAAHPTVHAAPDRQIQTRSTGRHKTIGNEVSIQYNLCNEPWLKYTLSAIADGGLKRNQWTSARLQDEVLFLETASARYQVARVGEAGESAPSQDVYCISKCKMVLPMSAMRKAGVPLPPEQLVVVEDKLGWEDLKWGVNTLHLRNLELTLKRMHFFPITKQTS